MQIPSQHGTSWLTLYLQEGGYKCYLIFRTPLWHD